MSNPSRIQFYHALFYKHKQLSYFFNAMFVYIDTKTIYLFIYFLNHCKI